MTSEGQAARWKTLTAFGIIYFVWGSTFLAIRIGVHEAPPFLFAAMRFLLAGVVLCIWMTAKGEKLPNAKQCASASLLAVLIFVMDYGLLFWAEQRVPSGIAAVMLATIPVFMALAEIIFLRTQRLTKRLGLGLLVGVAGVVVLTLRSMGSEPLDRLGMAALLVAALSWSIAAVLSRKVSLPDSKGMSAGIQMLAGGLFLMIVSAALGDFGQFHPTQLSGTAWFSLLYLIVAGSIVGFTAYVWLLHHYSATKVGTYAYVNPVVAVLIGYFAGGETLGLRTILGMALVLVSVLVITTARTKTVAAVIEDAP